MYIIVYKVDRNMRVISSSELRSNLKKYLDLAANEQIIIQRGRNETFVLTKQEYLEPDEDLKRAVTAQQRAVTAQQLMPGIVSDVREAYRKRRR